MIMLSKRVIAILVLFGCFESIGKNMTFQEIGEKLGRPVSSFTYIVDFTPSDRFYYTTELSRILLVGEPRVFETVRGIPLIQLGMVFAPLINNRLFDNRFEKFIENGEKSSQRELQEAIEDAIVLTTDNTNAYSVSKLLDYLSQALQRKIGYIKKQVEHDSRWDQQSLSSLKKSGAWGVGLMAVAAITNKYIASGEGAVSNVEFLNTIATLGLLPVSYKLLKNGYKTLTTNPHESSQHLEKYEGLLSFVQELKTQFKTNEFITLTLQSGSTVTVKNDTFNTVTFS